MQQRCIQHAPTAKPAHVGAVINESGSRINSLNVIGSLVITAANHMSDES